MNDRRNALWSGLVQTLQTEERTLAKLLRLTRRQHRYLMRADLRRVNLCLQEIGGTLLHARETTARRQELMRLLGFEGRTGASALKAAALSADAPWRERVERAVEALARATERLGRENVQNFQLARFSLDLVGEEMRLILGATDGSGAAYDAEGEGRVPSLSGAVDGRA
jgi:flagellar biosynthesis/type III secretory pathway chaperone